MKENKKSIKKKSTLSKNQELMTKNSDYLNIPETDEAFWASADIHIPKKKEMITLRLDPEIIEYFKNSGNGYQTKMNAILKSYVTSHQTNSSRNL